MEESRLLLHEELCSVLGSRHVYFQPPSSIHMEYPAIVYHRLRIETAKADNSIFHMRDKYTVTVITEDPDSDLPEKVLKHFSRISYDRNYQSDNLYHDVLTILY